MQSSYIVNFVGASHVTGKLCICTELLERGTVFDLIHKAKVSLVLKVKMAHDTSCALAFLHKNGVLYRDLKPDNLMVFSVSHSASYDYYFFKKIKFLYSFFLFNKQYSVSLANCLILVLQSLLKILLCRNVTLEVLVLLCTW